MLMYLHVAKVPCSVCAVNSSAFGTLIYKRQFSNWYWLIDSLLHLCTLLQVSWSPGLSDVLQQVEAKFADLKQRGCSREEFIKLVRSQVGADTRVPRAALSLQDAGQHWLSVALCDVDLSFTTKAPMCTAQMLFCQGFNIVLPIRALRR